MSKCLNVIGVLLLLLALSACDTTTREARRMVKRAELLADTLPDSTVHLIDSVLRMPANFSERERMNMALLQAEALFGSLIMDDDSFDAQATLSTSPELERASTYYAGKKQYSKAAHAALYSGFVQQHYNEKEYAMRSFKEAEGYGKLAVDSLTVAQAEYWMGKLLYEEGLEQEALLSFVASERYIGNRFGERALIENSKAVTYILMRQFDSAALSLHESYLYAEKSGSEKVKRKIYNNYSVLYRLQGNFDQAVVSLQQMGHDSGLDDTERIVLYLNLGKVYFEAKEMDSVAKYYQRVEALLPNADVKKETIASAYNALSRFAENRNEASLALQYREKHGYVLYAIMQQRQEQTRYRIQRQYDYESLQNAMNRKIIQRQVIILIISFLLLVSTIIVLILQIRHKQLLKSEKEMKQQMTKQQEEADRILGETVQTHRMEQAAISGRLKRSNQEVRELKDQIKQMDELSAKAETAASFVDEPICRLIMERVKEGQFKSKIDCEFYKSYALDKQQLLDLRLAADRHYSQFTLRLRKAYPKLTNTDIDYCCLYMLNLTYSDVSALMQRAYNTVVERDSKIRKIFGSEKPLPVILMDIAQPHSSI